MTLCDKGEGGQNWPKKRYLIVERPLIVFTFKELKELLNLRMTFKLNDRRLEP